MRLEHGKSGLGVPELLESIVKYLPAPQGDADKPLQALLIDSWYDSYLGVIILIAGERRRFCVKNSKSA